MKKILYIQLAILFGCSFVLTSCFGSDDDDNNEVWKDFQTNEFLTVAKDTINYQVLKSASENGFIMWQESNVIGNSDASEGIFGNEKPLFTDTVLIRYDAWYVNEFKKNIIFESTEQPSLSYLGNPNKVERKFAVNAVNDGWSTALQNMKEGDEKLIVVPQILGYGRNATDYIPAYTTLWYRIKLIKIIPQNGRK